MGVSDKFFELLDLAESSASDFDWLKAANVLQMAYDELGDAAELEKLRREVVILATNTAVNSGGEITGAEWNQRCKAIAKHARELASYVADGEAIEADVEAHLRELDYRGAVELLSILGNVHAIAETAREWADFEELEAIAKKAGFPTLRTRGNDSSDFHELSAESFRCALVAAVEYGRRTAGR